MGRSLLIVAENAEQLEMLARRFTRAGYQVVGLQHPRQALQAASFQQFQVALLDADLPEMDGIELMRRLQRSHRALQVVILFGDDRSEQHTGADGAIACLNMPCEMAVLKATIEDAFARAVH
jgi:DNA-binding NtrC family response regulator